MRFSQPIPCHASCPGLPKCIYELQWTLPLCILLMSHVPLGADSSLSEAAKGSQGASRAGAMHGIWSGKLSQKCRGCALAREICQRTTGAFSRELVRPRFRLCSWPCLSILLGHASSWGHISYELIEMVVLYISCSSMVDMAIFDHIRPYPTISDHILQPSHKLS